MHQTTVRFGADLWDALDHECAELGVSVAQFVRESALARLLYVAGRRGDAAYQRALELAGGSVPESGALHDRRATELAGSSAPLAQGRVARGR